MRAGRDIARHTARCAAIAAATTIIAGCATGLDRLPLPAGTGTGEHTYTLTAAFDNALNLPAKAKVKLNGADIGEVETIHAHNFTAYVTMHINSSVALPVGARAELRSATPLGDVFIAIKSDPNQPPDARQLHDGDTIPLGSTAAAATVEELLTSASLLVNGGAVRQIVTVLNGAGAAAGGRGAKIATMLHQSNDLLSRLNARTAQIRAAVRATSQLAATLTAQQNTLDDALAAAAPATSVIADNTSQLANFADTLGRITAQLSRFPSLQGTDTRSFIADLNHLSETFNDVAVDPNTSLASLNRLLAIGMKLTNSAAFHGSGVFVRLALGNHPDKNYPGDPAFHGPDGTDWHAMVGSLRYEWNLLLDKIYGPQR